MIQTSCFFLMFLLVLPYGKALIITVLLSIAKIPICESSSVVNLEHLMFSSVKNTNLPEMPHSCVAAPSATKGKSEMQ